MTAAAAAPAAPSLFHREDTILGVCEGIGEDFGFNAHYLRIGLAVFCFFNPLGALALYALLGVAVFAGRRLFPNPAAATPAAAAVDAAAPANDAAAPELAVAA
jgi:phage shock protein PspC (stress-responsive transcriptional regulator)